MRICMFTNTFYPHVGGVANSVAIFSEDLRKMGHEVLIIAPKFKGLDESQENSNEILRVPAIQNFNGSDFSVRLALPFLIDEKIDEFQPDIIHSNHPFLLGDAALRAAYRRNLPIVFTHHTRYEDYTHYVPLDSDLLKKYIINLATQYANYCSAVIAPSASIADLIVKRGVTKPVRTLPTGVDTKFFAQGYGKKIRKAFNLTEKNPIIGHVGRLAPEKNLNFLAKSTACFIENNPSAVFFIAGSGPSEEAIKKIFAAKGLDSKLIFAGTLKGQNLSDFYNAIDIFAFASKSETQGMVLTEAMAAGKPVVALTAPGVRDVLRSGENGLLLAEKATPEEFAQALEKLSKDIQSSRHWRQSALRTAKQFSRENCALKMSRLYQHFIENRNQSDRFDKIEQDSWNATLQIVKTEWELIQKQTKAVKETLEEVIDKKLPFEITGKSK